MVLILMFVYAVLHSILARLAVKARLRNALGERGYEGLYRLGYNAFAVVSLLPIFYRMATAPGPTVWQVGDGFGWVLRLVQLGALVALSVSLLQIDFLRFAGLRQALAYISGDPLPLPPEQMQYGGLYRLVRHPLYLFSIIFIWAEPTLSMARLQFNIASTLYFIFGSLLEERTLVALIGEPYRAYQRQVPWLVPWRLSSKSEQVTG